MTVLSGFEICMPQSKADTSRGLLAIINLGLALAGSYLLVASNAGGPDRYERAHDLDHCTHVCRYPAFTPFETSAS
jgi:hypothetical protein